MRLSVSRSGLITAPTLSLLVAPVFAQTAPTPTPVPAPTPNPTAKPADKPAAYKPYKIGDWTVSGSLRARLEMWDWFSTPGFDDNYTYGAYLLRAGLARQTKSADYAFE